ncbi:protein-L-isoaspartate O-methyltransferase-domain-containing protein, partial [Fomes fomentarius]
QNWAWRCTGATNAELINNMAKNAIITSERVRAAMSKVDRAFYVRHPGSAYEDSPQPIGHGATISAPHMLMQDPSNPRSAESKVVGIEHIPELVKWSVKNLRRDGLGKALHEGSIKVITGGGRKGLPEEGPYDAIHVGAAAPMLPAPLVEQLARPGRMFIPVGTHVQQIVQVDKDVNGNVTEKPLLDVMYVPLTDRDKQV